MPNKSVSRGRAFRQGILPWRKGVDIPVDSRYAACRPRLTAAQGPRVEQRAILARVRYATATRLREQGAMGKGDVFYRPERATQKIHSDLRLLPSTGIA